MDSARRPHPTFIEIPDLDAVDEALVLDELADVLDEARRAGALTPVWTFLAELTATSGTEPATTVVYEGILDQRRHARASFVDALIANHASPRAIEAAQSVMVWHPPLVTSSPGNHQGLSDRRHRPGWVAHQSAKLRVALRPR